MKLSLIFTAIATVSSVLAAPIVQERAVEKRSFSGRGTFYNVGLGACGKTNKNSQPIIAVNKSQFKQSLCGKWLSVKNAKNGKSSKGYVEDMCPDCAHGALDLSPSLFKKLASLSQGVITVTWSATSSKRSEDGLVLRDGVSDDSEVEDEEEDPDYKFDPADAITDEELAELLGEGSDELSASSSEATPADS